MSRHEGSTRFTNAVISVLKSDLLAAAVDAGGQREIDDGIPLGSAFGVNAVLARVHDLPHVLDGAPVAAAAPRAPPGWCSKRSGDDGEQPRKPCVAECACRKTQSIHTTTGDEGFGIR